VPIIGRAAARSGPWVVDIPAETVPGRLSGGAIVLVTGDSIDPVAKLGQWVILAPEDVIPSDGDLVAAVDEDGNRLLRRLSSADDAWILQPINPVRPIPCKLANKTPPAFRKVTGVLYLEPRTLPSVSSGLLSEWTPVEATAVEKLKSLRAIAVEGDSLDPIAWKGQWVLVQAPLTDVTRVEPGTLAAVATDDPRVGNVLKRVHVRGKEVLLLSPNPVDVTPPSFVLLEKVTSVWPFAGVLFEGMDADDPGDHGA
jgi:SOS-response transcriptional repressor LexA